jgi:hypothetical protein
MAYNSKYLHCIASTPGNGMQIWSYRDTVTPAAFDSAGYLSDGGKRGMRVGDMIVYEQVDDQETPTSVTKAQITFVASITAGAVDVVDGTAIDETDTD